MADKLLRTALRSVVKARINDENALRDQKAAVRLRGNTAKRLTEAQDFFARCLAGRVTPHLQFVDDATRKGFDLALTIFLLHIQHVHDQNMASDIDPPGANREEIHRAGDKMMAYIRGEMRSDIRQWQEETQTNPEPEADA